LQLLLKKRSDDEGEDKGRRRDAKPPPPFCPASRTGWLPDHRPVPSAVDSCQPSGRQSNNGLLRPLATDRCQLTRPARCAHRDGGAIGKRIVGKEGERREGGNGGSGRRTSSAEDSNLGEVSGRGRESPAGDNGGGASGEHRKKGERETGRERGTERGVGGGGGQAASDTRAGAKRGRRAAGRRRRSPGSTRRARARRARETPHPSRAAREWHARRRQSLMGSVIPRRGEKELTLCAGTRLSGRSIRRLDPKLP